MAGRVVDELDVHVLVRQADRHARTLRGADHALAKAQMALLALDFTVETHFDFSDSGSL
jgi:hypothetical protein